MMSVVTAGLLLLVAEIDPAMCERSPMLDRIADHVLWRTVVNGEDGFLLDRHRRLLARVHDDSADTSIANGKIATCALWDALALITPPPGPGVSEMHAPLLVDSQGNAWVIITHIDSGQYSLRVTRSDGHDSSWDEPETISFRTPFVTQTCGVIDANDEITIVFRDVSGTFKLYAMRTTDGEEWDGPTLVHQTTSFFQSVDAAVDEHGNVIVAFDPVLATPGVWTTSLDVRTDNWIPATPVTAEGVSIQAPTLAANSDGSTIYLCYAVTSGATPGLRAHRWDPNARTWEDPVTLPGTEDFHPGAFVGPSSRIAIAVGADDEATVLWEGTDRLETEFTVRVSRTSAGAWQAPIDLLPPNSADADILNFASIVAGGNGSVLAVISRFEADLVNRVYTFRLRDDVWLPPQNPLTTDLIVSTSVEAVMYRGARAIVTALGTVEGTPQLVSLIDNGGTWWSAPIDIPGTDIAFVHELADDAFEAVLVYEAEDAGSQGLRGAWLRDPVADVDCDGFVDVNDLLVVLGAWGGCAADDPCNPDFDGDGAVGILDLLIVLGFWD